MVAKTVIPDSIASPPQALNYAPIWCYCAYTTARALGAGCDAWGGGIDLTPGLSATPSP